MNLAILALIVAGVALLLIYELSQRIRGLELRLTRTQRLHRQTAERLGLPEEPLEAELRQLIASGQRVRAVKRVQEALGLTVRQSQAFVDSL